MKSKALIIENIIETLKKLKSCPEDQEIYHLNHIRCLLWVLELDKLKTKILGT